MNSFDILLLVIFCLFAIFGLIRGLYKQLVITLIWVVAFVLAILFTHQLAPHFQKVIHQPVLSQTIAFVIIFFVVWIVGVILKAVIFSGFGEALKSGSRLVGLILGFVEGFLITVLLVFIIQNSGQQTANWFNAAFLVPPVEKVSAWIQKMAFTDVKSQNSSPNA